MRRCLESPPNCPLTHRGLSPDGSASVQQRLDSPSTFTCSPRPVLVSSKLRVSNGDTPERLPDDVWGRRRSVAAEHEAGPGIKVGVSPTIQNNAGDVVGSVEPRISE